MSDFLQLAGRTFVVQGVANKKSVAWLVAKSLEEQGARVVFAVRSEARRQSLAALLAGRPVFVCDAEQEGACDRLAADLDDGTDRDLVAPPGVDRLVISQRHEEGVVADQLRGEPFLEWAG